MREKGQTGPQGARAVWALQACFLLSGLAALLYQTAWTRQFAIVFGTSEVAVASVLASYMAGLAIGAWLVVRWLPRVARPIRCYAMLEAGIAVAALLLVPMLLELAHRILVAVAGHRPDIPEANSSLLSLLWPATAFSLLVLPTALMGATLPVLARAGVREEADIAPRIGALYAWNTAGSVLGALAGPMVLLPALGLQKTLWAAGSINLLVCLLAATALHDPPGPPPSLPLGSAPSRAPTADALVLPLMTVSGASMFGHEVLWTRLLQRIVGGSVLAFGTMVAAFLAGIALGGAVGARMAARREGARRTLALAFWLASLAGLAAWLALPLLANLRGPFALRALASGALLLPLAFAAGLTYPAAVRVLARDAADAPRASARVYAWNTAGAIVGALLGGYLLLPWLRYEGMLGLLTIVLAVLGTTAAWTCLAPARRWRPILLAAPMLALATLLLPPPIALLRHSPVRANSGPIAFYAVGRSADVLLTEEPGMIGLVGNGLPEAAITRAGHSPTVSAEAFMGALVGLARPGARSALVVGYGGGNIVAALPHHVERIDVVELEPQILAANQAAAGLREGNPLLDARVHVVLNDARAALALSEARFDAILSQPSHPWTAGASHLYTTGYLRQVQAHLEPGGLFVQWMGAEFLDAALLRSWIATATDVFPHVRLYRTSATALLLLASDSPIEPEHDLPLLRRLLARDEDLYRRAGLQAAEDVLVALAAESDALRSLVADAMPITDDFNRLATSGMLECGCGLDGRQLDALLAPVDPLVGSTLRPALASSVGVNVDYLARRIVAQASGTGDAAGRPVRLAGLLSGSAGAAYVQALLAVREGNPERARDTLQSALATWPRSQLLLFALAELRLADFSSGHPAGEADALLRLLDPEPRGVLEALGHAGRSDWAAVATSEPLLAQVIPTAPWFSLAARLRVEWRARVATPGLRARYGSEGLAIADAMIATEPTATWHALRALSARGYRADIQVAATEDFVSAVGGAFGHMTDAERRAAAGLAATLDRALGSMGSAAPAGDPGLAALAAQLRRLQAQLH